MMISSMNLNKKDAIKLVQTYPTVPLTVDCVIFGFDDNALKVLTIKSDLPQYDEKLSLLGDNILSAENLYLERSSRVWAS
jgi:8-oxo-dGTP diphosphatase